MGSLYQNVCYPTQQEARKQVCSSFDASALSGSALTTAQCVSTDYSASTMAICKRLDGGTCATVEQPWPLTPDCSHEGGIALSTDWFYASITLVAIVWGGRKLIKLFDNNTVES